MSELRELTNEYLTISISDHGAELSRIYDKKKNYEVLWNANPAFWKRHAPVLFPIVGKLTDGTMKWKKKTYAMGQHGFARDMEFTLIKHTQNSITHRLSSNAETKKKYPFSFTLEITHTLVDNEVVVAWNVQNDTNGEMYFAIGAHPAFNVPPDCSCTQSDCFLRFGNAKRLSYLSLDPSSGAVVTDKTYMYESEDGIYPITSDMFDNDALIFDGQQISEATILWPNKTPYLTLHCDGFPSFGLWSQPGAPFICLEPWFGRTDDQNFSGDFSQKTGIQKLEKDENFHIEFAIEVH